MVNRRRWAVLAVLCTSLLLVGVDLTVLHVAVPTLARHLRPSGTELLWIVDVYALSVAASLVTWGTLGDRIGRRRLVLAGFVVFGLASAMAAGAGTPAQLIAARALLGVGAAMIMASTVAIIRVVFADGRERALAIGIWTAAHSVGAAIGPVVGGLVLQRWWWGAVFLINVPIAALALALGVLVIPESKESVPRRWDVVSAAMSVVGLAGVVYALKRAGDHGGVDLPVLAAGVGGIGLLALFVLRQRRLPQPLLDLSLFAARRFTTATLCVFGCFGCYTALLFFLTQRFQLVDGDSPLQAGLALVPLAAASAVGATVAPWPAVRWGNRWTVTMALTVFAGALAALAVTGEAAVHPGVLVTAGVGAGAVMTLGADSIMAGARPEQAGQAAAIQETSFELGAGMGIAILGTVLAVAYRTTLPPVPGLAPGDQAAARESIGTAVGIADRLAPSAAAALREAARIAFGQGFGTVTAVAAVTIALTAVMAATLLRDDDA